MNALAALEGLHAFAACTDAEDYFAVLDVGFDPAIVAVKRLHILKRFSAEVAAIDAERGPVGSDPDPEERLAAYRNALDSAYGTFIIAGALEHRLFKVLADHAPEQVVAVDAILRAGHRSGM